MPVKRNILHLDLDAFFVSVETVRNPALKGKPVLIGGGNRGVVSACSYEARKYGVHSAMPMVKARQLCKEAIVVQSSFEQYGYYSKLVTDIIKNAVPVVEKSSIDEFYADLTGMDKYHDCYRLAVDLKNKILNTTGLPISWALASNKLVSKIATNEIKPDGHIVVPHGTEKEYLAPLHINKMPGIGKHTADKLIRVGINTLKKITELSPQILQTVVGNADGLWSRANGIDNSPVSPWHEQKSISKERTFFNDTADVVFLKTQLIYMTEKVAYELRKKQKLAGCIAVKIRYAGFDTQTLQHTTFYTHNDTELIKCVKILFERLYKYGHSVRLAGVRVSDLITDNYQANLFDSRDENDNLYKAIDSVKQRFGEQLLHRASGLKVIPNVFIN